MEFNSKLFNHDEVADNKENQDWWQNNPMTYDWDKCLGDLQLTKDYFHHIDQIFGQGHALINNPNWPQGYILENFLPYSNVSGKKVLEIGCGAGLVSSHLAKAGAELTSIDLTNQAIEMTSNRFEQQGLKANIQQMDAEKISFEDNSFDYVISWGVIHHSGNMQAILDQIHRILKPGGKAYLMVYNLKSLRYQVYCRFWLGIVKLKFLKHNLDEIAGSITDGYIARHLTEPEFTEMSKKFSARKFTYSDEVGTTSGYLLGPLRHIFKLVPFLRQPFERFLAKRWGWYMEIELTK